LRLGNDDVERLTHGFGGGMTEPAFASGIPEADDAVMVGKQDRLWRVGDKAGREIRYGHSRSPAQSMD
jgi:hypothetical protein